MWPKCNNACLILGQGRLHILKLSGTIGHKKELTYVEVWFCLYFSFFLVVWSLSKHPYPPRIYAYKQGCANRFWAEYVNIRSAAKTNLCLHSSQKLPYTLFNDCSLCSRITFIYISFQESDVGINEKRKVIKVGKTDQLCS